MTRAVPTYLKILRGNPGCRPLERDQLQPDIPLALPDAPSFLTGYAQDEWYRLSEELHALRLLTNIDTTVLAAYCQSYKQWRQAVEALNEMEQLDLTTKGLLVKGKDGLLVENPLVITANKASINMVRYAGEFGLSPAARIRFSASSGEPQQSKFGSLIAS
jgi:P27 family predicted phage terminase small subunit